MLVGVGEEVSVLLGERLNTLNGLQCAALGAEQRGKHGNG